MRSSLKQAAKNVLMRYGGCVFTNLWAPKTHIFVAAMPKSGSTYLQKLLIELTGYSHHDAVQCYGHNEQDIIESELLNFVGVDSVSKQHAKGTSNNLSLMQRHGIRPVVQVRNIFDVLISVRDHLASGQNQVPASYVHVEYGNMTERERLEYIVRIQLPWYLSFYVSWREASQIMDVLWLTYQELIEDAADSLHRISSFYGLSKTPEQIAGAINRCANRSTRLNVGVRGRGAAIPTDLRDEVVRIAATWRLEDRAFAMLGIDA